MNLSFILLKMIRRINGERSINACLHLLKGKKSGQTIQDVVFFQLYPYFSLLPSLNEQEFQLAVDQLFQHHWIEERHQLIHLTTEGLTKVQELPQYAFNGWIYRGNEQIFFKRLSLAIQTLSYFRMGEKRFIPIQKERTIQLEVKALLRKYPISDREFARKVAEELKRAISMCELSELQSLLFVNRLSGYQITGHTWDQLAQQYQLPKLTLQLAMIESLHRLLELLHKSEEYPFLQSLTKGMRISTNLTESASFTRKLFAQGFTMEQIAERRSLKVSTIEDHFVEMALHDQTFPLNQFVEAQTVQLVVEKAKELGTKRLKKLKEQFPSLSYFQLRLILGVKSGEIK